MHSPSISLTNTLDFPFINKSSLDKKNIRLSLNNISISSLEKENRSKELSKDSNSFSRVRLRTESHYIPQENKENINFMEKKNIIRQQSQNMFCYRNIEYEEKQKNMKTTGNIKSHLFCESKKVGSQVKRTHENKENINFIEKNNIIKQKSQNTFLENNLKLEYEEKTNNLNKKGSFNGKLLFAKNAFQSEGEKLFAIKDRIERDCQDEIAAYAELCESLKAQKDYVLKKQAEILNELEETTSIYEEQKNKNESDVEQLMADPLLRRKELESLTQTNKSINKMIESLKNNVSCNNNSSNIRKEDIVYIEEHLKNLNRDKNLLIYKIYEEQENYNSQRESLNMLQEDVNSRILRSGEFAVEYEELDNILEEIKLKDSYIANEIFNELQFEKRKQNLIDEKMLVKKEIETFDVKKRNLELNLETSSLEIERVKANLKNLREIKFNMKHEVEESAFNSLKEKIKSELDENGLDAFSQLCELIVIDENHFEKNELENNENLIQIFYQYQDLLIKEVEVLLWKNQEQTRIILEEFKKVKEKLFSECRLKSTSSLLNKITLFHISDEIFLNLMNGIKNKYVGFEEDLFQHLKDKKNYFQKLFTNSQNLKKETNNYSRLSNQNIISQNNYKDLCIKLSANMRRLNSITEEIQNILSLRKKQKDDFLVKTMEENEKKFQLFISNREDYLRDLKFKFGKTYLEKIQSDYKEEFNKEQENYKNKLRNRMVSISQRMEIIFMIRTDSSQLIENNLEPEIVKVNENHLETKEKLTVLKKEILRLLKEEENFSCSSQEKLQKNNNNKETDFFVQEIFDFLKRDIKRQTEQILLKSSNGSSLTPFFNQKLLEEKISTLNENLDKIKNSELIKLEELEREICEREVRIKEKKKRILIISEYIKNKNINPLEGLSSINSKRESIQTSMNETTSALSEFCIKSSRNLKKNYTKNAIWINESNTDISSKFGKVTINFTLDPSNEKILKLESDDTCYNPLTQPNAEQGNKNVEVNVSCLTLYDFNECEKNSFNSLTSKSKNSSFIKNLDVFTKKMENCGIKIFKKFTFNKGNQLKSSNLTSIIKLDQFQKMGFACRILKFNIILKRMEFYKENISQKEKVKYQFDLAIDFQKVKNVVIYKDNMARRPKNESSIDLKMFGLEVEGEGILDCLVCEQFENVLMIKNFFYSICKTKLINF